MFPDGYAMEASRAASRRAGVSLFQAAWRIVPSCRLTVPSRLAHCSEPPSHCSESSGALFRAAVSLFRVLWHIVPSRRLTVPSRLAHCSEPSSHRSEALGTLFPGAWHIVPRCLAHCSEVPGTLFRGAWRIVPLSRFRWGAASSQKGRSWVPDLLSSGPERTNTLGENSWVGVCVSRLWRARP